MAVAVAAAVVMVVVLVGGGGGGVGRGARGAVGDKKSTRKQGIAGTCASELGAGVTGSDKASQRRSSASSVDSTNGSGRNRRGYQ